MKDVSLPTSDDPLKRPRRGGWTEAHYVIFRALLGLYLCVHFLQLFPYGAEVFSDAGVLPDGAASPLLRLFPNVLALCDKPGFVGALLLAGAGMSLTLAAGFCDRAAALALWYVLACLFGRNPLISNPSLPYVGLLLLAHASLPRARSLRDALCASGRRGSLRASEASSPPAAAGAWDMTPSVYLAVWVLMALGYSYSGYMKLSSPSWVDGTALARVLENPLARAGALREALLAAPALLLRAATWCALLLELLFAPLALVRRLRPFVWGAMLLMHLSLVALVNFTELSLGMVLLHLFACDPRWFSTRAARLH